MSTYIHPLDPTIVNLAEPVFYMDKVVGSIFDTDGNRQPCTITFWKSENEIKEIKVACPDKEYNDFDYDVLVVIRETYRNIDVIGDFEKINY